MNIKRRSSPGYVREDFNITPKMSTYLVAFMVTDLVKTNTKSSSPQDQSLPEINIWSRKEAADMTQYVDQIIKFKSYD